MRSNGQATAGKVKRTDAAIAAGALFVCCRGGTMLVMGARGATGYVLGHGASGTAAQWWLSGGVSAANCIAAYQAISAASLAASYTNLANPGTFDTAPGVAPTFDTATGWTFNGTTQYLTTGITPTNDQSWSAIGRFSEISGTTYGDIIGFFALSPNRGFLLRPRHSSTQRGYVNGGEKYVLATDTEGVMAMAGNQPYFNGSTDGTTIGSVSGAFGQLFIGRNNFAAPRYLKGKIQAVAIYNAILSAAQVAAISAAMAAL